jgi:uncharacterized protein YecE (DUF72 family)
MKSISTTWPAGLRVNTGGVMAQDVPEFLVGTASWTDPTLVASTDFYPPDARTAEDRLRFYAAQFPTVEVDSSYYAIPSERNSRLWHERTPAGFVFNVKAFAWLTQHPAESSRLPRDIKALLEPERLAEPRVGHPPDDALAMAFRMFSGALGPLRDADPDSGGVLGMVLFQFPPYFTCKSANFDYLASLRERMPGASLAIEFRHPSWVAESSQRRETMDFLRRRSLCYVSVDAPEDKSVVPSFVEATGEQAYVRFHGRNRQAWFKRGATAAERFKYLYAERELAERAAELKSLGARGVRRAFVIFNNCYRNFGILNATTMASMLRH